LKYDVKEGKTGMLAHEHAPSSFCSTTQTVTGESIDKGQAYYLYVADTICYRKVPVADQKKSG
jgi:hypothetical protein